MRTAKELIRFAEETNQFHQNAANGMAKCSRCYRVEPVVYGARLQWCQGCWSGAAPFAPDTQSKEWLARRASQERDYGWKPA